MKRAVAILAVLSAVLAIAVVYLAVTRRHAHPGAASTFTTSAGGAGSAAGSGAATGSRRVLYYRNPMNPAETSPTPKKAPDGMDYVPVYADESAGGGAPSGPGEIRIDPAIVQNMGITTATVRRCDLGRAIRTSGQIEADQTRIHEITTKVGGYIDKLYVDFVGQRVRAGDPLLDVYSPDVVSTEQEYLDALRNDPSGDLAAAARRRLELWNIPEDEIAEIAARGEPRRTVLLRAPASGFVLEKDVVQGAAITAGMRLFRIADLSRVWVEAHVFEYELPWVRLGAPAVVELPYFPGQTLSGTISYIDPTLSPDTRTALVRVELPNTREPSLRPGMFATVRLVAQALRDVLVVPDQAVLRSGNRTVVVLSTGDGRVVSRDVTLGLSADSLDQVVSGLNEGDRIVTSGQFLIDSESNLRAAMQTIAPRQGAPPQGAPQSPVVVPPQGAPPQGAQPQTPAGVPPPAPAPAQPQASPPSTAPPESMPPMPGMPGMR